MKKILIVASVISFIEWFNKENVIFLKKDMKCEVHIACNLDYYDDTDIERTKSYIEKLKADGIILHNIRFARSPLSFKNIKAYRELKAIVNGNHFDLIHCHTPTASMLTRLAARKTRKKGTIVMYTCHGFHFHNSSPKKNWLMYYPIEKWLSRYCDYLVTINREDFNRAKTFKCENVRYIPGVGVDIDKIKNCHISKEDTKESIGVPKNKIMLLSIGEMIKRKNHQVIVRALGKAKNPNIYYVICGKGPLEDKLKKLAQKNRVMNRVIFLGFRTDIPELCNAADISAFPSKIEGLGLAGLEALSAGVPLVSSNVHGILDYVVDGETGYSFKPNDVGGFSWAIDYLSNNPELRAAMKGKCIKTAEKYDKKHAIPEMWKIYQEALFKHENKIH